MAGGLLSDRGELESLFEELAEELSRLGINAQVVMVGGSWMLWHAQRASTRDVDSARRFDSDLSEPIARVASRHDLRQGWLNDDAAAFWPSESSYDDCDVVYQHGPLVVRTPAPEIVFVMKLYRADPQDREDLISIWPLCRFADPETATQAFRTAYVPEHADQRRRARLHQDRPEREDRPPDRRARRRGHRAHGPGRTRRPHRQLPRCPRPTPLVTHQQPPTQAPSGSGPPDLDNGPTPPPPGPLGPAGHRDVTNPAPALAQD